MATITPMLEKARRASREIALRTPEEIDALLLKLADATESAIPAILAANASDMERMDAADPRRDRLQLTEHRIKDIASDMRAVASLPSPLGVSLSKTVRPNGMTIEKVTVPVSYTHLLLATSTRPYCLGTMYRVKASNAKSTR